MQEVINKIKIAVVGCGRISNKHLDAINHHKAAFQLAGLCDSDTKIRGKLASEYSVPGFPDIGAMCKSLDFDVAVLCTPSGLHSRQTIQLAENGKHIITEKPMATRWQDGIDMVRACDNAGVKLFVVKQNRFNPTVASLKQAISRGDFGRIYMVHCNVFWTRPQSYYDQAEWRGTWEFDGGALMNQASHYVDLMEWLIGPVESVHAMTATLARAVEVEDTAAVNIRYRSGAIGSMAVTMLTYPRNLEGSITIIGEKGTVKLGGIALNKIEHWEFESGSSINDIQSSEYETESVYGNGHIPYYGNVADVLHRGKDMATSGREGLRSLEVLIAMYLSSQSGHAKHLPLTL